MEIIIKGEANEIAALVLAVQERQEAERHCKNCGAIFYIEDNYCGKCGEKLKPI